MDNILRLTIHNPKLTERFHDILIICLNMLMKLYFFVKIFINTNIDMYATY